MSNLLQYGRTFLFSLLLLSYIQGAFQQPLLEVFHMIVHIHTSLKGDFHYHTYHSHTDDHRHTGLEKIEESQEDQENNIQEIKLKKDIEIVEVEIKAPFVLPDKLTPIFTYRFSFQDPIIQIFVPPPGIV